MTKHRQFNMIRKQARPAWPRTPFVPQNNANQHALFVPERHRGYSREFNLLEKEAVIISNPKRSSIDVIKSYNIQSCICLVLYHPTKVAVIHANGSGNEVAAIRGILTHFEGIDPSQIQASMIGGDFTDTRSDFVSELYFWGSGKNSNAIAHPMLNLLKNAGITVSRTFKNKNEQNTMIAVYLADGQIHRETYEHETAFLQQTIESVMSRPKDGLSEEEYAAARLKGSNYFLFDDTCLSGRPVGKLPSDTCEDKAIGWFPSL